MVFNENEIMDLLLDTPEYAECLERDDFIGLRNKILNDAPWSDVVTVLVNAEIDVLQNMDEIPDEFFQYSEITSINIPSNIKKIGNYAFKNCRELKTVTMSDSVKNTFNFIKTTCDDGSEQWAADVKDLNFEFGVGVFSECTALENIRLSDNIQNLPPRTFEKCSNIRELILPLNIRNISRGAFRGCTQPGKWVTLRWTPEFEKRAAKGEIILGYATADLDWLLEHLCIRG